MRGHVDADTYTLVQKKIKQETYPMLHTHTSTHRYIYICIQDLDRSESVSQF